MELKRVPEGGIQPQTAIGQDGTVHLVYFKGDPLESDLFYARSKDGVTFSDLRMLIAMLKNRTVFDRQRRREASDL